MYSDFTNWRLQLSTGNVQIKPNVIRKLWKETNEQNMPLKNEEEFLSNPRWLIEEFVNKIPTIVRLIFEDPLFTPIRKETLQKIIEFLSNYYPPLNFHQCFTATRVLTKEEDEKILKEAHLTHLGEMNTLERAKKIGLWLRMDQEVREYVIKCPICQLQKTKRIKSQAKKYTRRYTCKSQ